MLLPWLILIPFIGGLLSWQAERIGSQVPRWVALLTMGLTLVISVQLWLQGDYLDRALLCTVDPCFGD